MGALPENPAMGALPENQLSSVEISDNSKMHPSPGFDKVELYTSIRKTSSFSSVASSPDSPLDSPFKDVDDDVRSSSSDGSSPEHDKAIQLCSVNGEKPVSGSCEPKDEPSDPKTPLPVSTTPALPTASPPTQVMEHSTNEKYRIPSSVFARANTTNPMDWSVCSNESLFSIHVGNMSFINDNSWVSGDLGPPGELFTSDQEFDYSTKQDFAIGAPESKSGELRTDVAIETTNAICKDGEDQNNDRYFTEGRISHNSTESSYSTKSFAFPLLASDVDQVSARLPSSSRIVPDLQPRSQVEPTSLKQTEPKAAEAEQQLESSTKCYISNVSIKVEQEKGVISRKWNELPAEPKEERNTQSIWSTGSDSRVTCSNR